MARVLVSGAAGFLGSHLARALVQRGNEVTILEHTHLHDAWRLREMGIAGRVKYIWKAIQDATPGDMEDYVIHCAASSDVAHTRSSPRFAIDTSIQGTVNLLEACRSRGVKRVVVISSYSVYGRQEKQPIDEAALPNPSTLYGAIKLGAEKIALSYVHEDVPIVALRLATLYGSWARATVPVAIFLRQALAGELITLTGDGEQKRDHNYIDNAVPAILSALDADAVGEVINVGSGREVSMLDLAIMCVKAAGRDKSLIHFAPPRRAEEGRLVLNIDKAKRLLKYEPLVQLEDGINTVVQWMRKS